MDLHEQNTISPFFSMKRHLQHKRNYGGNKCNNVSSPLPNYPQCTRFTPAVDRIFKGEMRQYCGRKLVGFRTILVCLWHNKKVKFMHKKDSLCLRILPNGICLIPSTRCACNHNGPKDAENVHVHKTATASSRD